METDLEMAYRTLNALSQGQEVSGQEIELALACVNRAIHQVRAMRRVWSEMGRYMQPPDVWQRLESQAGDVFSLPAFILQGQCKQALVEDCPAAPQS
jgi:hypothetical protein